MHQQSFKYKLVTYMIYSDKKSEENIPRNNCRKSSMSTSIPHISSTKILYPCGDDAH